MADLVGADSGDAHEHPDEHAHDLAYLAHRNTPEKVAAACASALSALGRSLPDAVVASPDAHATGELLDQLLDAVAARDGVLDAAAAQATLEAAARLCRRAPFLPDDTRRAIELARSVIAAAPHGGLTDLSPLLAIAARLEHDVTLGRIAPEELDRLDAVLVDAGLTFIIAARTVREHLAAGDVRRAEESCATLSADDVPSADVALHWLRRRIAQERREGSGRRFRAVGAGGDIGAVWRHWDRSARSPEDIVELLPGLIDAMLALPSRPEDLERLTDLLVDHLSRGHPAPVAVIERFIRRLREPQAPTEDDPGGAEQEHAPLVHEEQRIRAAALRGLEILGADVRELGEALERDDADAVVAACGTIRARSAPSSPSDVASDGLTAIGALIRLAVGAFLRGLSTALRAAVEVHDADEVVRRAQQFRDAAGLLPKWEAGWVVTAAKRALEHGDRSGPLVAAAELVSHRLEAGGPMAPISLRVLLEGLSEARRNGPPARTDTGGDREAGDLADLADPSDVAVLLDAAEERLVGLLLHAPSRELQQIGRRANLHRVQQASGDESSIDVAEHLAAEQGPLDDVVMGWLVESLIEGRAGPDLALRTGRLGVASLAADAHLSKQTLFDLASVLSRTSTASGLPRDVADEVRAVLAEIEAQVRRRADDEPMYAEILTRIGRAGPVAEMKEVSRSGDLADMQAARDRLLAFGPLGRYEMGWLVAGLCRIGEVEFAIEALEDAMRIPEAAVGLSTYALMPVVNILTVHPTLDADRAERLVADAEAHARHLGDSGVVVDAPLLQALIMGHARALRPADAERLIRDWPPARGRVPADGHHFSGILHAWSLSDAPDAVDRCRSLLDEMRTRGLEVTEWHLLGLAVAIARRSDVDGVVAVLDEALAAFGTVSAKFIETVARNSSRGADPSAGPAWAETVAARGLMDHDEVIDATLDGFWSVGAERLQALFAHYRARGLLTRPRTLEHFAQAAVGCARVAGADEIGLLRQMGLDIVDVLEAETVAEVPLSHLARLAKATQDRELTDWLAERLAARLDEDDEEPEAGVVGAILEVIAATGDASRCDEVFARLVDPARQPPEDATYLYNVLISAHNRAADVEASGRRVEELFAEMRGHGLSPDFYTVAGLSRAQELTGAFEEEVWHLISRQAAALTRIESMLQTALHTLRPTVDALVDLVGRVDALATEGRWDLVAAELPALTAGSDRLSAGATALRSLVNVPEFDAADEQRIILDDIVHELSSPIGRVRLTLMTLQLRLEAGTVDAGVARTDWAAVVSAVEGARDRLRDYEATVSSEDSRESFLLKDAVEAARRTVRRGLLDGIDVDVRLDQDRLRPELRVVGSRFLLTRAFWALLTNAAEAIRDAGIADGRIGIRGAFEPPMIRASPRHGQVTVTVDDNGPGVRQEDRDRIFLHGVTTKSGRGLGLGLAMVQSVVRAHQGTLLLLQTGEGTGATFQLRLPAAPGPGAAADIDLPERRHTGTVRRVLPKGGGFVEDDEPGLEGRRASYFFGTPRDGQRPSVGARISFAVEERLDRKRGVKQPTAVRVRPLTEDDTTRDGGT